MCGIFGVLTASGATLDTVKLHALIDRLFILSETRGREAAGLALRNAGQISIYKSAVEASRMIRDPQYRTLVNQISPQSGGLAAVGHSRLVTDGHHADHHNNQPVACDTVVAVHNGIIVNAAELWDRHSDLERRHQIDTEIMVALIDAALKSGMTAAGATQAVMAQLEGTVSTALMFSAIPTVILATNNGSLYWAVDADRQIALFASERFIVEEALTAARALGNFSGSEPRQIPPNRALEIRLSDLHIQPFALETPDEAEEVEPVPAEAPVTLVDYAVARDPTAANLTRCTKCLLPGTMPFVDFDTQGVCSYCRNHNPAALQGPEALEEALAPFRRNDGRPDCLVAISGGRDSSYGLHLIKTELGMNPIAFTYDWGMVTDLARRNQARLCGKLGIEHVIVSADIRRKRHNIRRNVEAWLKQPDLGMVPLFTAGDKQFYYHADQVMKKNDIKLLFYLENERYEKTSFKAGFCNINEGQRRLFNISLTEKLRLGFYYGSRFVTNPRYLNRSLVDTFAAYLASYFLHHDFISLFQYLPWDEETVASTLRDQYDWELATDTKSTWRIGDGTAAFYNYIYYTLAGFTEHDTFRSHQIRDGVITREEALAFVTEDNRPRWQSMEWYANAVGFDLAEAVRVIETAPRLYALS